MRRVYTHRRDSLRFKSHRAITPRLTPVPLCHVPSFFSGKHKNTWDTVPVNAIDGGERGYKLTGSIGEWVCQTPPASA